MGHARSIDNKAEEAERPKNSVCAAGHPICKDEARRGGKVIK